MIPRVRGGHQQDWLDAIRAGIAASDGAWSASVYVRNAFDEAYYQWGFAAEAPIPATQVTPAQGRAAGVEFRYRY